MASHQEAYWEGLEVVCEPRDALCGRKHFFIEDPNGILVDVAENVPLSELMNDDERKDIYRVA